MIKYDKFDLYMEESVDKQLQIAFDGGTITNKEIPSEQFELTESLTSESQLVFGSCEASEIKFRIYNVFLPLKDKWLTVTETLNGDTENPLQIGKYKVYSDKPTADRGYRDIVAYDSMYDIINTDVASWYNSLTFPMQLKTFRDSFFDYFGIDQEEVALINDDMTIEKTVEPSVLSGKDVIQSICELNGCFGHIGRDGKFQYIHLENSAQGLYPSNDLYPAEDLFPIQSASTTVEKSLYISCEYEDFISQSITKLQIREKEGDVGGIAGEGDNSYIIEDNFLLYGKSTDELNSIAAKTLEVIGKVSYRPFKAEIVGNPCFEVGDAIRLFTKYEIIETYILNRTLSGIQGLRDDFSADGEEYFTEKVNDIQTSITQLKGKTNTLERTIEETRSTITDVESGLQSQITQTAESITSTVASTYETKTDASATKKNLESQIEQTAESITSTVASTYETKTDAGKTKKELQSEIKQTAESISLEVADNTGKISTIEQTVDGITQTVEDNKKELSSRIEQTVSNISLTINNGDSTAGIVITLTNEDGSTSEVTGTIDMTGLVTFTDLLTQGQTVINGSNITTGQINCDLLNGGTINGQTIKGGSIEGTNISATDSFKMLCYYNLLHSGYETVLSTMMRSHLPSQIPIYGDSTIIMLGNDRFPVAFYGVPSIFTGSALENVLYSVNNTTLGTIDYLTMSSNISKGTYIHCQTTASAYGITIWESDTKLKENIKETEQTSLDKINQLEFIQFDWKKNEGHVDLGLSANQVEEIIPSAVFEVEQGDGSEYDTLKNIDTPTLTTYSLKAIQEMSKIIETQQQEIEELKKSVSFLMSKK